MTLRLDNNAILYLACLYSHILGQQASTYVQAHKEINNVYIIHMYIVYCIHLLVLLSHHDAYIQSLTCYTLSLL